VPRPCDVGRFACRLACLGRGRRLGLGRGNARGPVLHRRPTAGSPSPASALHHAQLAVGCLSHRQMTSSGWLRRLIYLVHWPKQLMSGHFRAEWLYGAGFQRFHNPPLLKTGSGGPPRDVAYFHVNNSHGSFMRKLPVLRHGIGWLAAQTDASSTLRHSRVVVRSPLLSSFSPSPRFYDTRRRTPPPHLPNYPPAHATCTVACNSLKHHCAGASVAAGAPTVPRLPVAHPSPDVPLNPSWARAGLHSSTFLPSLSCASLPPLMFGAFARMFPSPAADMDTAVLPRGAAP